MKMTSEKRQGLITECQQRIKELEGLDGRRGGISKRAELQLDINRIALAALTAEPVAWEVKGILCHTKEDADKYVGHPVPLIESLIDNTAQQYEALAREDKC